MTLGPTIGPTPTPIPIPAPTLIPPAPSSFHDAPPPSDPSSSLARLALDPLRALVAGVRRSWWIELGRSVSSELCGVPGPDMYTSPAPARRTPTVLVKEEPREELGLPMKLELAADVDADGDAETGIGTGSDFEPSVPIALFFLVAAVVAQNGTCACGSLELELDARLYVAATGSGPLPPWRHALIEEHERPAALLQDLLDPALLHAIVADR